MCHLFDTNNNRRRSFSSRSSKFDVVPCFPADKHWWCCPSHEFHAKMPPLVRIWPDLWEFFQKCPPCFSPFGNKGEHFHVILGQGEGCVGVLEELFALHSRTEDHLVSQTKSRILFPKFTSGLCCRENINAALQAFKIKLFENVPNGMRKAFDRKLNSFQTPESLVCQKQQRHSDCVLRLKQLI